jgi:hypothetical protein
MFFRMTVSSLKSVCPSGRRNYRSIGVQFNAAYRTALSRTSIFAPFADACNI